MRYEAALMAPFIFYGNITKTSIDMALCVN